MNIIINEHTLNGFNYLELIDTTCVDQPAPLVFFLHGYTNNKELSIISGYKLARNGYRVILLDAKYHGERRINNQRVPEFRLPEIINQCLKDIDAIHNELTTRNLVIVGRVGVTGESLGGITTLAALTQFKWIDVAVSLMGTPSIYQFFKSQLQHLDLGEVTKKIGGAIISGLKDIDLSRHPEALAGRNVLLWHGDVDQTVPYYDDWAFYKTAKHHDYGANLSFELTHNVGHYVGRDTTDMMVAYFKANL